MKTLEEQNRAPMKLWEPDGFPFEHEAMQQIRNVASLPFIHHHVAVMADAHFGIGATVGSVIATRGAVIPASVGVDIGCGMVAARTPWTANDLPDSLKPMSDDIEWGIPVGFNQHKEHRAAYREWASLAPELQTILAKHPKLGTKHDKALLQLGTLGGGNHFIEVCLDEEQRVWLMLHSGSRNIGNVIGHYFIEQARQEMLRQDIHLPDRDLAYLSEGSESFRDYIQAVWWAQRYASANRMVMLETLRLAVAKYMPTWKVNTPLDVVVSCHHNYVSLEEHFGSPVYVTRKGAVRAGHGDLGVVPGSMGAKSYIVRGKGNPESFESCAHGAGRRMSRGAAKRAFTLDDHMKATAGVECRKDRGVLDETPGAYKPIDVVMKAQEDLIEIAYTLKQVLCVKG